MATHAIEPQSGDGMPGEVIRERLLSAFCRSQERLVIIAAPGGYGKTYLAKQISALPAFDRTLWLDFGRRAPGDGLVAQAVVAALSDRQHPHGQGPPIPPWLVDHEADALVCLQGSLDSCSGESVCIVLDDISLDSGMHDLSLISRHLIEATSSQSAIVLTTRDAPSDLLREVGCGWAVDASALKMSRPEADQLLAHVAGRRLDECVVGHLLDTSGGQPALLSVLARHVSTAVDDTLTGPAPLDVSSRLELLAREQLSNEEQTLLFACALLGRGSTSELEAVFGQGVSERLGRIAECVPLVEVAKMDLPPRFHLHDFAQDTFTSREYTEALGIERESIEAAVLDCLDQRGDVDRVFTLLLHSRRSAEMLRWLLMRGDDLLGVGSLRLLSACIESIPMNRQLEHPRLVLLHATLCMMMGDSDEARQRAMVARELAEHEGDQETSAQALLLLARLSMDSGDIEDAVPHLKGALASLESDAVPDMLGLVYAYLVICYGHLGRRGDAERYYQLAEDLSQSHTVAPWVEAYTVHAGTIITGLLRGQWSAIVDPLLALGRNVGLPVDLRLKALNNASGALLHMGRLRQAEEVIETVIAESEKAGLSSVGVFSSTHRAIARAASHHYAEAESLLRSALASQGTPAADPGEDPAFQARWRRACGDLDGALAVAEDGVGKLAEGVAVVMWRRLSEIEVAASLLALGDCEEADDRASALRRDLAEGGATYHVLCADLVLSEIARQQDRFEEAVTRLLEHADYIRTESANLVIAFYVRAFPGLLGVLAAAVGANRLPAHLLQIIGHDEFMRALRTAWGQLDEDEWRVLAGRLLGPEEVEEAIAALSRRTQCEVRLFGGLEVDTPDGAIPDRAWRKRKARLLFAMLVTKQGRDIPRDQLLDYLWPDMPEDKARNNFYVVWNTLKGALSPNLPKGENCPFVESVGGLCRVNPDLVRSDLDDFEEALEKARDAETSGAVEEALGAYRRIGEIYRGDLLPGDVYDDWFAPLRERCRQQFGDAMLSAARLSEKEGQNDALHLLRIGLEQDPLREDLYQEMLRHQITSGMRSAAIETYMTCRGRLCDELGLDPSVETRALYDQVLAMEETDVSTVSAE